jgi:hypothetical protein
VIVKSAKSLNGGRGRKERGFRSGRLMFVLESVVFRCGPHQITFKPPEKVKGQSVSD